MKRLDAYPVFLTLEGATALILSFIFTVDMVYQVSIAHLNPLQLVLVGTTLEASIFLLEIPTGIVADVYSRRLSIIIGVFLIGLGFVFEGSLPLFLPILLSQVIWGAGYTFTSGATQAWISDEIGEAAAGRAFLRASQVGNIGALLGIAASAILGSLRVNLPIVAGGAMFILLAAFLALVMPESGFHPTPDSQRNTWQKMGHTFRSGLQMVNRRPALRSILAIGLFYGLYSEAFDRLWTKHILDSFSLPALGGLGTVAWFGIIRMGGLLLSTAAAEVAARRLDVNQHLSVAWALMGITSVLVASLLVFAQAQTFVLALAALWAIDVSRNVIGPIYTAWVNQRLDSQVRATVLSMSSQVDAIGQIAGGPVLGLVGSTVSVQAALTLSGLVLSPVLGLYARIIRKERSGLPVES